MSYMRWSAALVAATFLGCGIAAAAGLQVAAGCTTPPTVSSGNVFYIDPVNGSATGNGSKAHPWNSLQAISGTALYSQTAWEPPGCHASTDASCTSGPLLAVRPYWHKDLVQNKWVTSTNPNAPIKPGDTILLMSGNYGDVSINSVVNPAFTTIAAGPNQTPILSSLQLDGSTKWIIQGLKFLGTGNSALINVSGNSSTGAGGDIIINSNNLASQDNVDAWSQATWLANARPFAILVDGGDQYSTYEKCVTLTNNSIANVRNGIIAEANNMLVDSNTIQNFGGDGVDFAANNLTLTNNKITDNRNLGDGNHNDAMQGQPGRGVGGVTVFNNIMIGGNVVVAQATRNLTFPGVLQGIDAFDMDWSNVSIINNVVIVNAFHGIAFYSLHGGLIANNTVLASSNLATWIGVFSQSHQGSPANNVTVRNNIASNLNISSLASTNSEDHNLVGAEIIWPVNSQLQWLTNPGTYANSNVIDPLRLTNVFVAYGIPNPNYDVHLLAKSLAIGTGNPQAPLTIAGTRRTTPVDLGAYVYTPSTGLEGGAASIVKAQ